MFVIHLSSLGVSDGSLGIVVLIVVRYLVIGDIPLPVLCICCAQNDKVETVVGTKTSMQISVKLTKISTFYQPMTQEDDFKIWLP